MSIRLMTWVWDHSPYEGARLLVHLAIADHANDQGQAWPSQETLADKARCSVEWVRQTVSDMQKRGLLEVTKAGRGRGNTVNYRLICSDDSSRKTPTPQTPKSAETPNSVGETPNPSRTKTPTPSGAYREPSGEPPKEPSTPAASSDKKRLYSDEAHLIAAHEWERRARKPVCGFIALRLRIQEALDAGYPATEIEGALPTMTVFSRNAFDLALGRAKRPTAAELRPMDRHMLTDRTRPTGRISL